jgi:hypothetical protein
MASSAPAVIFSLQVGFRRPVTVNFLDGQVFKEKQEDATTISYLSGDEGRR